MAKGLGDIETVSRVVQGERAVMAIVVQLIADSQFHAVLPLPDDQWEIYVRKENEERLRLLVEAWS